MLFLLISERSQTPVTQLRRVELGRRPALCRIVVHMGCRLYKARPDQVAGYCSYCYYYCNLLAQTPR